jgi:hypothetical protein
MKRTIAIALFATASLVAVGSASAQQEHAAKADIPFSFAAGNQVLPSGTYVVTSGSSRIVRIDNRQQSISIVMVGTPDADTATNNPKLVFDRIGNQYFLREVVCTNQNDSVSLAPSKLEKTVLTQEARNRATSQTTVGMN